MSTAPESATLCDETALLGRIAAGDRQALRVLYDRYRAALFTYALRLVSDRGAAEEILQDTFIKIWRHAVDYDPRKSRPFTWAVTILRRTSIDYHRRAGRAPVTTPLPTVDTAPGSLVTPERARDTAEAHEAVRHVRAVLAGIASPQRDALELALFSTLTHAEIATRLAEPVGTVKSWIRRGLLDLRDALRMPNADTAAR